MADLTVDADQVAAVSIIDSTSIPRTETVPIGGYGRIDANGRLVLGNATTAGEVGNRRGIVFELLGETARVLHEGILDLGDALASLSIGDLVYVSNTDGTLADAAGTVSTVVGVVVPGLGETTADKLLQVSLNV